MDLRHGVVCSNRLRNVFKGSAYAAFTVPSIIIDFRFIAAWHISTALNRGRCSLVVVVVVVSTQNKGTDNGEQSSVVFIQKISLWPSVIA